MQAPGTLHQDLVQHLPEQGLTLARTETVVSTDLAAQVRVIRSAYELVTDAGVVTKRFVEWPYRYLYRFEAELLLEQAGFDVEAIYGGYAREPFVSDSRTMLILAPARSVATIVACRPCVVRGTRLKGPRSEGRQPEIVAQSGLASSAAQAAAFDPPGPGLTRRGRGRAARGAAPHRR